MFKGNRWQVIGQTMSLQDPDWVEITLQKLVGTDGKNEGPNTDVKEQNNLLKV